MSGEWMAKVAKIFKPGNPIRKCDNCGIRTTLQRCPSVRCGGRKTIVVPDEGHITDKHT